MDQTAATFDGVVNIIIGITKPIVSILIAIAVLYFVWGVVMFIGASGDEGKVAEGRKIIGWGLLAIFVMVSMWGLVAFVTGTFGIGDVGVVNSGFVKPR